MALTTAREEQPIQNIWSKIVSLKAQCCVEGRVKLAPLRARDLGLQHAHDAEDGLETKALDVCLEAFPELA